MFRNTKFKKGDYVLILNDMSEKHRVVNVYLDTESYGYKFPEEMVVLDNGQVYHKLKLTFYSEPIKRLNDENIKIKNNADKNIAINESNLKNLDKDLSKLRKEVFGESKVNRYLPFAFNFAKMFGFEEEEVKPLSLVERIEALEAVVSKKKVAKVVAKKTKKSKK